MNKKNIKKMIHSSIKQTNHSFQGKNNHNEKCKRIFSFFEFFHECHI